MPFYLEEILLKRQEDVQPRQTQEMQRNTPPMGRDILQEDFIKKDESRLCRLVFYWSPSLKIRSIRVTITTKTLWFSFR